MTRFNYGELPGVCLGSQEVIDVLDEFKENNLTIIRLKELNETTK